MNKNIITQIILIILVISFFRIQTLKKASYWENKNRDHINKLYVLFDKVEPILKEFNYFLCSGTLLGAMRNGKIIPWDDDIDVGVYIEDPKNIEYVMKKMEERFSHVNLNTQRFFYGLLVGNNIKEHIDIFFFTNHTDNKIRSHSEIARKMWPSEYFYKDEVKYLSKIKFGEKICYSPSNTLNVIKRHYGENCLKDSRITHNHTIFSPELNINYLRDVGDFCLVLIMSGLKINQVY